MHYCTKKLLRIKKIEYDEALRKIEGSRSVCAGMKQAIYGNDLPTQSKIERAVGMKQATYGNDLPTWSKIEKLVGMKQAIYGSDLPTRKEREKLVGMYLEKYE